MELGWKQCTVADAALIQTLLPGLFRSIAVTIRHLRKALLPCLFRSIATTIRHLRKAGVAFRILSYILVPSPHTETVGVECRAWQCFAAGDTLHFRVVVGGPASFEAM